MSFDIKAKEWDLDPQKVERASILSDKLREFTVDKSLKNAIEFGCGTGLVSFFLKDDFSKITLADTSFGMIDVLKKKISDAGISHFEPILIDENTNFQHSGFDITYSLLTLHHIQDLNKAFNQFYNLLKPGGYLCIADLVEEDGDFHNAEDSKHVHHGFEKEKLINQLETISFKFVDYQIFHHIERVVENGSVKNFPMFLLIVQK